MNEVEISATRGGVSERLEAAINKIGETARLGFEWFFDKADQKILSRKGKRGFQRLGIQKRRVHVGRPTRLGGFVRYRH